MPPARSNSANQSTEVFHNIEGPSGFDATFEPRLDKKYTCPICLAALRDPVQTKCGHRFCKCCILRACHGRSRMQAKCPIDKITFDVRTELFEDIAFKREILSLLVLCANKGEGCVWNGELRELEGHGDECLFANEVCPNGCEKRFLRKNSTSHQNKCELRFVECAHCKEMVIYRDLETHHHHFCKCFPVNCSQCGKTGLLREQLSSHLDAKDGDCPDVIVPCTFHGMGCDEMLRRQILTKHIEDSCGLHLQLMFKHMTQMKNVIAGQQTMLQEARDMCNQLLCDQVDLARQLEERNDQIALQSEKINELQSTSFNGVLHWKVALPAQNYTTPILSPVIYTSRPGYKFQLCLELRGHAARNETHASLFIMLCHGDHDEQLYFPFNGTCRVTLYNQSQRAHASNEEHESRNNITTIECFNIPRVETATSQSQKRGRLRYMKTDALVKGKYCHNGVLFFKVEILTSGVQATSKSGFVTSRSL